MHLHTKKQEGDNMANFIVGAIVVAFLLWCLNNLRRKHKNKKNGGGGCGCGCGG